LERSKSVDIPSPDDQHKDNESSSQKENASFANAVAIIEFVTLDSKEQQDQGIKDQLEPKIMEAIQSMPSLQTTLQMKEVTALYHTFTTALALTTPYTELATTLAEAIKQQTDVILGPGQFAQITSQCKDDKENTKIAALQSYLKEQLEEEGIKADENLQEAFYPQETTKKADLAELFAACQMYSKVNEVLKDLSNQAMTLEQKQNSCRVAIDVLKKDLQSTPFRETLWGNFAEIIRKILNRIHIKLPPLTNAAIVREIRKIDRHLPPQPEKKDVQTPVKARLPMPTQTPSPSLRFSSAAR
jgi:hypothetical protein